MPQAGTRGVIGRVLFFAAAMLSLVAGMVYAGALPVEHEVRARVALVIGAVAASDAALGVLLIVLDRS